MRSFVVVTGVLLTFCVGAVQAGPTLSFDNITNNNPTNAAIGEAQLFVEVTQPSATSVGFLFTNIGPEECAITDVYFDDDGLFSSISGIEASEGVDFSVPATPPDLPGGHGIDPVFDTTIGLSADSNPPVAPNGVNPGEDLTLVLQLQDGKTYTDVINALTSGDLRIGIHVQAFENEGSEAFVNDPPTAPAPGAVLLAGIGIGLVGWIRQRKAL